MNSVVALQHPAATGLDRVGNGRSLHPCQLGVIVGSRLASTRDPTSERWFVALLVVVAIYTAARSASRCAERPSLWRRSSS